MKEQYLPFLDDRYLEDLAAAVRSGSTLGQYKTGKSFAIDLKRVLISNVKMTGKLPDLKIDDDDPKRTRHECANAIKLYEHFSGLTDVQASDPRLWGYLSHTFYFPYIQKRWKVGSDTTPEAVLRRFFVGGVLSRHALAGLWWAVKITRAPWDTDPTLLPFKDADPYKYTRILFTNQDIYVGLLERRFGRAERLLVYVLDELGTRMAAKKKITNVSKFTQLVARELNLVSSYRVLESVPHKALKDSISSLADRFVV